MNFRMIINYDKKYLFVHIPRSAGTNLYNVLSGEKYDITNKNSKIFKGGPPDPGGHYFTRKIISSHEDGGYDIKDFTIFSIVRNPYDRLHSEYWMREEWNKNTVVSKFQTWLLNPTEPPAHAGWDIGDSWNKQPQKTCMLDWLTDIDGNIIVDHILRYENLMEELKELSKIIDEPNLLNISREKRNNSPTRPSYKQAYTEGMINFVKEFHKKDLEFFGYEF